MKPYPIGSVITFEILGNPMLNRWHEKKTPCNFMQYWGLERAFNEKGTYNIVNIGPIKICSYTRTQTYGKVQWNKGFRATRLF